MIKEYLHYIRHTRSPPFEQQSPPFAFKGLAEEKREGNIFSLFSPVLLCLCGPSWWVLGIFQLFSDCKMLLPFIRRPAHFDAIDVHNAYK